jgi:hypothetical protein
MDGEKYTRRREEKAQALHGSNGWHLCLCFPEVGTNHLQTVEVATALPLEEGRRRLSVHCAPGGRCQEILASWQKSFFGDSVLRYKS